MVICEIKQEQRGKYRAKMEEMHISSLRNGKKTDEKTLQNASFTWYNYHKYTDTWRICRDLLSFGILARANLRTCGGKAGTDRGKKGRLL